MLEDDAAIVNAFTRQFEGEVESELVTFSTYTDYEEGVKKYNTQDVKCVIFDLSNDSIEDENTDTDSYTSVGLIREQYMRHRIPIFIHSAKLSHLVSFEGLGTIIKKEKTSSSIEEITNSISLMEKSGFLDIFCQNGLIENQIMRNIHQAFTSQFAHNEIENIIKSIQTTSAAESFSSRTFEVFERLAMRAVFHKTVSDSDGGANSIELYFRRMDRDKEVIWTGDIIQEKSSNDLYVVVTPRCNVKNKNFSDLLLCKIQKITQEQEKCYQNKEKDDPKKFRRAITDDVSTPFISERFRFLPPTPQFIGGFVDCRDLITIPLVEIEQNFRYMISLYEDITNDVVRKIASYLLRGGISDTNYQEAFYFLVNKTEADSIQPDNTNNAKASE